MKTIIHVDADSFYVSCERIRDASLKNKPVGVLGNQGACVIARSYEMKPLGIKVGMPVWEAKKLCPDGIFIKRDFQWYGVLSKEMQQILRKFSDVIEYYSIDESFLDMGDLAEDKWDPLARRIQNEMMEKVGMPVSVGISMTRTLAKTASDKNKPLGITVVTKKNLKEFLKTTPVGDVPGIGTQLKKRLNLYNVESALDFVKLQPNLVKQILHKPGEELWYELRGKPLYPIRGRRPEFKCLSRGGSLWGRHKDPKYIWGFLVRNLERFADGLWKENLEAGSLIVILGNDKGMGMKWVEPLPDFTQSYPLLLEALKKAVKKIYIKGETYTYSHILGAPLRAKTKKQLNIFQTEIGSQKEEQLISLKKELNKKFGVFSVRSAATAFAPEVFKDQASDYEISDIEGKFCF